MSKRLLYGILAICSFAMLLFVIGFVCFHLGLAFLTAQFYAWAGKLLLLAIAMLLISGAIALLAGLYRELQAYFCREAAVLRRLLAIRTQKANSEQLRIFKHRQLHYFSQFKRQRLLAADNRKQLRSLYKSIDRELQDVKANLSPAVYRSLSKTLRQYYRYANAEGMLVLRERIVCR